MRILVIGSTGQLGWELQRTLAPLGTVTAVDYPDLDLTREESIIEWIDRIDPELILNAAAYTAVDQAEEEPDLALAVNARAPGILAEQASRRGSILIHYSTDFVFDGKKGVPYSEDDPASPLNTYGRTKLAGEDAVRNVGGQYYIFRTSWLYSTRRACFLSKVLSWARTQEIIKVVADQVGSPTWAYTLAEATARAVARMVNRGQSWRENTAGVYHTAGIGAVNRYEWAKRILALDPHPEEHVCRQVLKATSADFNTPAIRPAFSALDCSRFQSTFDAFYSSWDDALQLALSTAEQHT